jgi:hypothetical protein
VCLGDHRDVSIQLFLPGWMAVDEIEECGIACEA